MFTYLPEIQREGKNDLVIKVLFSLPVVIL